MGNVNSAIRYGTGSRSMLSAAQFAACQVPLGDLGAGYGCGHAPAALGQERALLGNGAPTDNRCWHGVLVE